MDSKSDHSQGSLTLFFFSSRWRPLSPHQAPLSLPTSILPMADEMNGCRGESPVGGGEVGKGGLDELQGWGWGDEAPALPLPHFQMPFPQPSSLVFQTFNSVIMALLNLTFSFYPWNAWEIQIPGPKYTGPHTQVRANTGCPLHVLVLAMPFLVVFPCHYPSGHFPPLLQPRDLSLV